MQIMIFIAMEYATKDKVVPAPGLEMQLLWHAAQEVEALRMK
jgi:hypothetical protein